MAKSERATFGSKLGIILATAGSAVGLGNVWRFPYMTGEYGGSAFILIYLCCVLLLGIPCMISEFIIGRKAAANTARAYRSMSNGTPWMLIGYLGIITGFLITSYYAVVSGWCLQYIMASLLGHLNGSPEFFANYFETFKKDPFMPAMWTVAILVITHFIVTRGVQSGIEKASKLMMPTLFVLLIVIVIAACCLPNSLKGVEFLLKPDFSAVNSGVFLGAMGQAFYSLSIGMGCLCTYASYFSKQTNLTKSAVQICTIDTLVAILAGFMIFPAAFSVGISPNEGPSLVFITLPNVFQQAFASMPIIGYIVAFGFYTLLALAALTSLISLHEVSTAFISEEFHASRKRAAIGVTVVCSIIGIICSLSLGKWDFLKIGDRSLFECFDFLTGQILLPLGGFLTCLFVGWYLPKKMIKDEFTNQGTLRGAMFKTYYLCIKILCPIFILLIFLHQFGIV